MADPVSQEGAVKAGSRYAALSQDARELSGLITQRSPYSNFIPYMIQRFYKGLRIDPMIDGANREISQKMTDRRRPGNAVYNANTFPAGLSFYDWKYQQKGQEILRVLLDGVDGNIYDATTGQKTTLLTKSSTGAARMLGVNTELFVGDGIDQKKVLRSAKTWQQDTTFNVGDFIVDSNGNLQGVQANPLSFSVTSTKVVNDPNFGNMLVITLSAPAPVIPPNQTATFSGMTGATFLNGVSLLWQGIPNATLALLNLGPDQIAFLTSHGTYGPTADTGQMIALTGNPGASGLAQPIWSSTYGAITNDNGFNGGVNWTCFGSPVQNWGIAPVPSGPAPSYMGTYPEIQAAGIVSFWAPDTIRTGSRAILDPNGNIQAASSGATGLQVPSWSTVVSGITTDGTAVWTNYGPVAPWYATTNYGGSATGVANPCVILDSNGNLQGVSDLTTANTSSAGPITWNTTLGGTTTDGAITWIMLGPGTVLWSGIYQYAWSPVGLDGTVGTASPITLVANGGLGVNGGFVQLLGINITGTSAQTDKQVAKIALWRTAAGQATLILLDYIPNPTLSGNTSVLYYDVSTDLVLGQNAEVPAPVAESADPPPLGYLPMCYALQRVWGIVDNMVQWSAGPDAVTGNGLTQFPPLNEIAFIGKPYAIFPITVQDGGQVVFTSSGIWIILGSGTASDPFYARPYFQSVNVTGYNAVTLFNQMFFVIESNLKVSSVAVQFPFQPATGYVEVGFPIGDQFKKVTTGGYNANLFSAASAFVSWNNESTSESALYVSDGAGHWFRMNALEGPETGLVWSPIATIAGGASAVMSVETSPGVNQLLLAPAASGPILARDDSGTVFADNGVGYDAWDAKGVTLLCGTGQWAETAHIATKSAAVGARPTISVLLGEIAPSPARPYNVLEITSTDPPDTPPSLSAYSDRYALQQNGIADTSDCILVKFDYGSQTVGDELLAWGMLASVQDEREEPVSK